MFWLSELAVKLCVNIYRWIERSVVSIRRGNILVLFKDSKVVNQQKGSVVINIVIEKIVKYFEGKYNSNWKYS